MLKITHYFIHSVLALILLVTVSKQACAKSGGEEAVKTALLFNFFKFIEWPETAKQNRFNLCTGKNDTLGDSLLVVENKTIAGKPIILRREISGKNMSKCHMVFISSSVDTQAIIHTLNHLPIVIVSDKPGFIKQGGMIGLVHDGLRLSFEINLDAAKMNGIHISAKLLKLAKTVYTSQ